MIPFLLHTVTFIYFEQNSYTIPVTSENITLKIIANGTLETNITLETSIVGINGVSSSGG